ncbi:hypothetical protein L226DRAFT_244432 [Lentinus tigrinus ALCF2SS1-7]|uniref:Uncharacterized protein n=1 Tax=Lentinus tigrinus ALCF2SS1-6 TaxID=1328759 RepID=A0A5C2SVX1_9APHY|nr:hypothetical protein L227DRAFT_209550 [Lentinus tigrinus ALCF2SS1-6]RPD79224.1 hypothetical protein L226DRAFT_244432 [Lentinus tigrinus ALCF2SS1-7]
MWRHRSRGPRPVTSLYQLDDPTCATGHSGSHASDEATRYPTPESTLQLFPDGELNVNKTATQQTSAVRTVIVLGIPHFSSPLSNLDARRRHATWSPASVDHSTPRPKCLIQFPRLGLSGLGTSTSCAPSQHQVGLVGRSRRRDNVPSNHANASYGDCIAAWALGGKAQYALTCRSGTTQQAWCIYTSPRHIVR